jgi:hypothetical protein
MNNDHLSKGVLVSAQLVTGLGTIRNMLHFMGLFLLLLCFTLSLGACAGSGTQKSTGQYIDDATITTKVKTALFEDSVVSGFQINVETYKGNVQLNGFVDTQEQKEHAEEIAQNIEGVKDVINNLTVKGAS